MTKSLFCIFTIYNTVVIIHIHAEFYRGIWFSFAQEAHSFHMARYVLIDVSFREPIQTNVDCSKISPFVCGNISTNSVAKNYGRNSLSISQSEPRPSTEKFNFFIRFYNYSDSNIKVKFNEELPSSPPCLFFVQRTGQRLFFAPTNDPTPMHSTLVS